MNIKLNEQKPNLKSNKKTNKDTFLASRIFLVLTLTFLLANCLIIVHAGERGVLMTFGKIQERVLDEGIHVIIPIVDTVEKLSVRVQKQEISAEASSKDLQDVFTDVALNWHINPEESNLIFQQIGNKNSIVDRIINPAVEEVLKAVMAEYTAEEIITKRRAVKAEVDTFLTERLTPYHLAVDDISLVHVHFSERFGEAVEAKQIAEQEAKRAGFMAIKAAKEAEAKVNLARGEAEAQGLIRTTLNNELLKKQAIEKWDGKLPLIMGNDHTKLLELELDNFIKNRDK
ncbi:band 7 protein [Stanieria cyanosphaera PCC 7437]|uniref:Band 7 protein n=1 Tax=Stanieria cyanosphaera (strain ATCC 29371 / PCC 7437) TaxID=111780 RepID=K9XRE1_STAC7|nr:prohibitin family protein [Stanieria cyanosphaera]AFZ35185.1 band 7 protein [Stanieria cyanosphaera PCC 7437]